MPTKNVNSGISFMIVLLLILGNSVLSGSLLNLSSIDVHSTQEDRLMSLIPHNPIIIVSDSNFSDTAIVEGWLGNGSSADPYIIAGLDIDLGGGAGHCINISNTRVNFTIQNCNLTSASSGVGIYLNNVSFGFLFNNTCTFNGHGIYLLQSTYNILENNTCLSNSRGISLYGSDFNTVTGNDCDDNSNYGIFLQLCESNLIFNNQCSSTGTYGIDCTDVTFTTLANNTCNQNYQGIRIRWSSFGNVIENNTCSYNSNCGIAAYNDHVMFPLYIADNYCTNNDEGIQSGGSSVFVMNNILIDNEVHGLYIQCSESVLSQNSIIRSYRGIYLYHTDYSTISNNEITGSSVGLFLEESSVNMISENSILDNFETGIQLEHFSYYNTIFLNDISINTYWDPWEFWGIRADSSTGSNNLTMNYILFIWHVDTVAIEDDGDSNLIDRNWYEEYSDEDYNEDGYWDTPYSIPGSAGNSDPRPLVYLPHRPEWIESPTEQVIDYWGQSFYYDLNASAPSPITWSVNDTIQFTINSDGVLETNMDLPVGSYGLSVKVTNIYGLYLIGSFRLIVQEVSLPEWIVGPVDFSLDFGEEFEAALIVTDESGISLWSINDSTNFTLTVTQLNVTGYNYGWHLLQINNATVLRPGLYQLNTTVWDPYGNTLSGIFTITVVAETQDTTPPIWVVTPTDQIITEGDSLTLQLAAWDSSSIDYGLVNDTIHFTIDENWILRNATDLQSGIYGIEVRLYDPFDNFCSANLTVTVLESSTTPAPTTTTTTQTTSTTTSSTTETLPLDDLFPMMTFVLGISLGGGVVSIIVIVLYKKSK